MNLCRRNYIKIYVLEVECEILVTGGGKEGGGGKKKENKKQKKSWERRGKTMKRTETKGLPYDRSILIDRVITTYNYEPTMN